ncbi:hypothetical protein LguiB_035944 [Lonicera macranthoides]
MRLTAFLPHCVGWLSLNSSPSFYRILLSTLSTESKPASQPRDFSNFGTLKPALDLAVFSSLSANRKKAAGDQTQLTPKALFTAKPGKRK